MRILKGNDFTLASPTFVGTDRRTPTAPTGTPTCAVTREDGTSLTAATVSAGNTTADFTAALTAATHLTQCDRLTVTWAATVAGQTVSRSQIVEVVGGHYISTDVLADLDGLGSVPVEQIESARDWFENLVEHHCGVAFVPRYQRDLLDGNGGGTLLLSKLRPREVLSVTINGTTQDADDFTLYDHGAISWSSTFTCPTSTGRNVAIAYEHGYDCPPDDLHDIALEVIRYRVLQRLSDRPSNFISETTINGTQLRYSTPDPSRGRPTGIMALDPWILENTEKVPGIA